LKTAIITGISGQDGAYLSKLLLEEGFKIIGLTRDKNRINKKNLSYLNIEENIQIEACNLLDYDAVCKAIIKYKPAMIFNFSAQSSVGLSFTDPVGTISYNTLSVLNLLNAIKEIDRSIKFFQASSSEMFGAKNNLPLTENSIFKPVSPYGISKATAYWTTINYKESYNMFACSGIMFNHESALRPDNFIIKKTILAAVAIHKKRQDFLKVGNLDVKRDFGYAPDYVKGMYEVVKHNKADEYIFCSEKSISIRSAVYYIFDYMGLDKDLIVEDKKFIRPNEIYDIYGNSTKAKKQLNWNYNRCFFEVLDDIIPECIEYHQL